MAVAEPKAHRTATSTPAWRRFGVPVAIVILLVMAVALLPRGYDTDLGKVGDGRFAVVQVFDKNFVQSEQLMDAINEIRARYERRGVNFLVADMGTDQGRAFAQAHGAASATALIFDPTGKEVGAVQEASDPAVLSAALDRALAAGD